ncbi:MAG: D-glucuronyl C5-epimerase family protein [Solirubrobacteraceae bacterium]
MSADGSVHARFDRFVDRAPAAERRLRTPAVAAAPRAAAQARTPQVLQALLATGQIDQATHDRALAAFRRASELARKLGGARAAALRGVVADLEGMAARGAVTANRLPALVETLERNSEWWSTGPLLSSGARVSFAGSGLVWQHYPGHGIQIQWLGTWGKANGLWATEGQETAFANLVAESVSLAANRAGGIGFEYLFPFDGGTPPWVSGLAQGTALTALVRAGLKLKDSTWYDAARQAIGIFRVPPPEGIAQRTAAGTHYLQYSFAPKLHILNGFIQSLNGVFDYAKVLDDEEGRRLFAAGRAEAAAELPKYDTGGWSRYSEYTESSLHYHDVLRGFLATLCTRLQRAKQADDPFCHYAAEFTLDLTRDPVIALGARGTLRARQGARVRFTIDKPGTVTLVIRRGTFTHRAVVPVRSGAHSFGWRPPAPGTYAVSISATDYAGNASTVTSSATVGR